MAMKHEYSIGIIKHTRLFDSNAYGDDSQNNQNNWLFKYITKTMDNEDAVLYPDKDLLPKEAYTEDTIFFDSEQDAFTLRAGYKNVYIDKSPIKLISNSVEYLTIDTDHKVQFTVESSVPIDVKNFIISCGNPNTSGEILYEVLRKNNPDEQEDTGFIKNITINKRGNEYTITFYVSKHYDIENLAEDLLWVSIWNIAGNTFTYTTAEHKWVTINSDYDINSLIPLKIVFVDPQPESRIVYTGNEGSIRVQVQNTNTDFYSITPTVELDNDSIGVIDESTLYYDEDIGTLSFTVKNIIDTGYVIVNAYLKVANESILGALKNATYATGMDGEWFSGTEGRKISFSQNVPKYLKNDNYASFTQMTQDFMNTMYTSLSNNSKHISVLEKIARISNFDDIQNLESSLIHEYKKQYNIVFDPALDVYKQFLEDKIVETNTTETITTRSVTDDGDIEINEDVMEQTMSEFMFQDLSGDELYSFVKSIYKSIPYYNQMCGTYRGIRFILNQLGLCVKIIEIWSTRNIISNFEHNDVLVRETDLNAVRGLYNNQVSEIGRYYLTSRFDVDVLETRITFEKFNELANTIVDLILKVKPIHRVLRNLNYVCIDKNDLHDNNVILEHSNGGGDTVKTGDGTNEYFAQKIRRYKYTWNLFDKYAVKKSDIIANSNKLIVNSLFIPFNSVDAWVKYNHDIYNDFGEYKTSAITGNNKVFFWGKYEGLEKPVTPRTSTVGPNEYVPAVKNSFHNLCNFETKLAASFVNKLRIKFTYAEELVDKNENRKVVAYNQNAQGDLITNTIFSSDDPTTKVNSETFDSVALTYNNINGDKLSFTDLLISKPNIWTQYIFTLGGNLEIKSATNGFYLMLNNVAKTILQEIGLTQNYNKSYILNEGTQNEQSVKPICLLCRIEDIGIPLGTNYINQLDAE